MINPQNFQLPKSFCPPQYGDVIEHNGRLYLIGQKIGKGYFGNVFECEDEWGNELVAKVLVPQNQTHEEVQQQWLHELGNLVHLRHPNITYVYDAFECQHTFYLIIERCSFSLNDVIQTPNNLGKTLLPDVARDILQALYFIHNYGEGYVHKDIHPGNVFVSIVETKQPVYKFKIGDLGISRLASDINIFNTILAEWMRPPESLSIKFGKIGQQVDIYHTGLLLLSLLLGYIPQFTRQEVSAGEPRKIAESLASPYGSVIANALRRHVADRTQTALDFWREISQVSKLQQ